MAYSWQAEQGTEEQELIHVNVKYLNRDDIHVFINSNLTTAYTWVSDKLIKLNTPLRGGEVVKVVRSTSRSALFVSFSEGTPFDRVNLDIQNTQFLYLAQEISEGVGISSFFNDIEMNGFKITGLADPVNDNDAAPKWYVDRVTAAAIGSGDRAEAAAKEAEKNALQADTAWKGIQDIIGGVGTIVNSVNGEDGDVVLTSNDIPRLADDTESVEDALVKNADEIKKIGDLFHPIFIVDEAPKDGDGQHGDIWFVLEDL